MSLSPPRPTATPPYRFIVIVEYRHMLEFAAFRPAVAWFPPRLMSQRHARRMPRVGSRVLISYSRCLPPSLVILSSTFTQTFHHRYVPAQQTVSGPQRLRVAGIVTPCHPSHAAPPPFRHTLKNREVDGRTTNVRHCVAGWRYVTYFPAGSWRMVMLASGLHW